MSFHNHPLLTRKKFLLLHIAAPYLCQALTIDLCVWYLGKELRGHLKNDTTFLSFSLSSTKGTFPLALCSPHPHVLEEGERCAWGRCSQL